MDYIQNIYHIMIMTIFIKETPDLPLPRQSAELIFVFAYEDLNALHATLFLNVHRRHDVILLYICVCVYIYIYIYIYIYKLVFY